MRAGTKSETAIVDIRRIFLRRCKMCKCEKRARTKAKRANETKPDDLPFVIKDNQIKERKREQKKGESIRAKR